MGSFVGFPAVCPIMEKCRHDLGELTAYHDESLHPSEVEPQIQLTQKARYTAAQGAVPYTCIKTFSGIMNLSCLACLYPLAHMFHCLKRVRKQFLQKCNLHIKLFLVFFCEKKFTKLEKLHVEIFLDF